MLTRPFPRDRDPTPETETFTNETRDVMPRTNVDVYVIVHVYTAIAGMLNSIELGNIQVRVSE